MSGTQSLLQARYEKALLALQLIEDGPIGEPPGGTTWDLAWAMGLASSALVAIREMQELSLCDDDGIVRSGRFHHGIDYPCTGSAHFGGIEIVCASPAHRRGA